jgi:hypothetical protein
VHDPFTRATGEPDEPDEPEKNVGQNIVCARTSAGYPIANKPVMPKDTAKLENLGIPRRMPRPRFKVGNVYFIFRQCLVVLLQRLEKIVAIHQLPLVSASRGASASAAAKSARLPPECVAHGLRKAALRLAEHGSTSKQIPGHKSLREFERLHPWQSDGCRTNSEHRFC